ncbi:glutaminyl-peptide cyclotransferase [Acidomonas methanolica]|uniref:Glutamine cyclotransferase n=1 Tax=Acidomonas methanolica NBRC 104435 TaxID=1231351 RepID=A0A023D465_ACIMT|nr:glutaminyl-peptide cyclotransferase [Acidomonas methanolica]TCS28270.1 glutaminyl-peptide cyclotransferase [Acidomonas methanolica]GAJ28596.1 glutamine cyclotransferase [Acidomonas methanolica NBRC 104435]GEK98987.1 glutamine cyclotransferase [Acidomonas methanolica NBRC 104435]
MAARGASCLTVMRFLRCLIVLAILPAHAVALPVETARVLHVYPHDPSAFTEGLLIHDGRLYESTGYEGASFIREEDLRTGRVLRSVQLPPDLFGEGIVAVGDEILSVTWRNGVGFRWSLPDLRRLGRFQYPGEGWGMTYDGRRIILSDGTPVLRFLDPGDLHVVRRLTVTADGVPLRNINELEMMKGEVLANIWLTNEIARIDPATGKVIGWIDLTPLVRRVGARDVDAVLNGIAYDAANDRLYVTGKDWPLLFEIMLSSQISGARREAPPPDTTAPSPEAGIRRRA